MPSLKSAAEATAHDPLGLAKESRAAAAQITRETTGAIFTKIGSLLQTAGDRLNPPPGEDTPAD